ncbi:glycosyltransferase family 2 protein [Proteus penneri]|uniref:glycosyltransferase family 2 protein n=1 Tax=Proteus penneri TaxID=102862 RepID=UPI001C5F3632|nr:glycosyltransferase family 2 protein [Proteus penneri]
MNNTLPLISVVMPTYNVAPWIKKSIDSILKQTYPNIELIIIDDCSTDNTYNIIKKLAKNNPKIIHQQNSKNLKICQTLNKGIKLSKGNYIARIDGDDIADLERIQKQYDLLVTKNLDLVGCQMIGIDENDNKLSYSNLPCGSKLIDKTKLLRTPITHIWLCKKDIYIKLNYYREIPYAEDYDFILRAIDFGYKCDNHPEKLMFIRHRAGNTASTVSLKQRKTHSYVIKLAKEREKIHSLNDSFSSIKLEKHIHYWNVTNLLHNYSSKQLNLAYKENNKFKKIMYIILCISTSIYNFSYLIDKLRYVASYKKITRKKG